MVHSLRQQGSFLLLPIFALRVRAKNRQQKKDSYALCRRRKQLLDATA
jgi:hypothetical protein